MDPSRIWNHEHLRLFLTERAEVHRDEDPEGVDWVLSEPSTEEMTPPWNRYSILIERLLAKRWVWAEEIAEARRSLAATNPHLHVRQFHTSAFGEWGENFLLRAETKRRKRTGEPLRISDPHLRRPDRGGLDQGDGSFDLICGGAACEVKTASVRATHPLDGEILMPPRQRTVRYRDHFERGFAADFNECKPQEFKWAIFVAVWTDEVLCWLVPSAIVEDRMVPMRRHSPDNGKIIIDNRSYDSYLEFKVEPEEITPRILENLTSGGDVLIREGLMFQGNPHLPWGRHLTFQRPSEDLCLLTLEGEVYIFGLSKEEVEEATPRIPAGAEILTDSGAVPRKGLPGIDDLLSDLREDP